MMVKAIGRDEGREEGDYGVAASEVARESGTGGRLC